jgi:hypothetical protein
MDALRRAAAQALAEWGELELPAQVANDVVIERVSCDVQQGRQTELVSLVLTQGRLKATCTCGQLACLHVRAALQLLAAVQALETRPISSRPERVSVELRVLARQRGPASAALSEALADVVTAVVRTGVASERVASVLETLDRVEAAAGTPPPLGCLRWLGRMREALDTRDVALAAQALMAAAALSNDLRAPGDDPRVHARIVSWLGSESANELERLSDRSMLEIAREWVSGTERHQIERRYLVDLQTGEVFREECVRRRTMSSLGPCPRLIGVSLAEAELSAPPRRMRLLQYTTTPQVDRDSWELLASYAQRDADALTTSVREGLQQFGALFEPFALLAPRALQRGSQLALQLERGVPVLLVADDEPGLLARFASVLGDARPAWVAGRLALRGETLALKPLSAAIVDGDRVRHERL